MGDLEEPQSSGRLAGSDKVDLSWTHSSGAGKCH